ncbi:hypothetical protein F8O01_10360 [Pseudoclavibacter chungangensis]|uniref:Uncharacterized protein n=1 Tax=Pseudoclavibacter chungangensis TaxID=587635 RepID=A0A7J5BQJ7_9MICO|nr:hypothetical protein [Pseudoclavibacter chungangensis]KAB1656269.1 hypothetical protein F8O01_10360 [Pseudoclavibacter chungangensis]NYJ67027.1 hypothetical protein [Pseudoclavibacter chungangensis]
MRNDCPHEWLTESRHRASAGLLRYERCACGARRISVSQDAGDRGTTSVEALRRPGTGGTVGAGGTGGRAPITGTHTPAGRTPGLAG